MSEGLGVSSPRGRSTGPSGEVDYVLLYELMSAQYVEMERDMASCNVAFNQGDAKTMVECFDPEIVLYTPHGEFRGRTEVMGYLTERYFKYAPKLRYEMKTHDVRSFGDALWYSYDYEISTPNESIAGHGMSMCRKDSAGRWRILNMHNSLRERSGEK